MHCNITRTYQALCSIKVHTEPRAASIASIKHAGKSSDSLVQALVHIPKTLVFAPSAVKVNNAYQKQRNRLMKHGAAFIANNCSYQDCTVCRLHSNTEIEVQKYVSNTFCKIGGHCRVCFATAVMEHGIDCDDVDRVVHVGCPTSPEALVQGLGRAGRRPQTFVYSIVFWNEQDFRDRNGRSFNVDMIRYCKNQTLCRFKLLRSFFI